jgi:hypothetical protein
MKIMKKTSILLFAIFLTTLSFGQTTKPIEYLSVNEKITLDTMEFHLVWTSHPTDNYYKQEYLSKDDTLERYSRLVMLEVVTGKIKLKDVVALKVSELEKMKLTNPVVHYETFEKDGEMILDFLVSESAPDGKHLSIIERNVYRYKSFVDKNGQKGIILFGVSDRAYGDDIRSFFAYLKEHRYDLINSVGAYEIPLIAIKK